MERQYFSRVSVATCAIAVLCASAAQALPVLIAQTGFESSEGYIAGSNVKGQPASMAPMPDGLGWGSNNWAGDGTGTTTTPVLSNSSLARDGDQYFIMHCDTAPSSDDNRLRRKYDTSLIQGNRVAYAVSVRLDTDQAEFDANGRWFASNFNVYLEQGTSSNLGKQNVRVEFSRSDGNINVKVGGSSVPIGLWTDANGGMCAQNTWLDMLFDVDIAAQTFDLYMNGADVGNYGFNAALTGTDVLHQIRFMGARNYTGYLNSGASVDRISLTTIPEPASVVLLALASGLILRRRSLGH